MVVPWWKVTSDMKEKKLQSVSRKNKRNGAKKSMPCVLFRSVEYESQVSVLSAHDGYVLYVRTSILLCMYVDGLTRKAPTRQIKE